MQILVVTYVAINQQQNLCLLSTVHRNEKLKCQLCNKVYTHINKLKLHLKTHNEIVYLKCLLCDAKYTIHAGLRQHVENHHPERKFETTFTCDLCNYEFYSKVQLERHMKCHSGLFKCYSKLCFRGFKSRHTFRKHYLCTHNSDIKVNFYELSIYPLIHYLIFFIIIRNLNDLKNKVATIFQQNVTTNRVARNAEPRNP